MNYAKRVVLSLHVFFRKGTPRAPDGVEGFPFRILKPGEFFKAGSDKAFAGFFGTHATFKKRDRTQRQSGVVSYFSLTNLNQFKTSTPYVSHYAVRVRDGAEGSKRREPGLLHTREHPKRNPASPLDSIFEIGAVCGVPYRGGGDSLYAGDSHRARDIDEAAYGTQGEIHALRRHHAFSVHTAPEAARDFLIKYRKRSASRSLVDNETDGVRPYINYRHGSGFTKRRGRRRNSCHKVIPAQTQPALPVGIRQAPCLFLKDWDWS